MTNSLIWKGFEEVHTDFPETHTESLLAGFERFNEAKFKRDYTVFRPNQIGNKIVILDPRMELPYNSILHVLDNVNHLGDYQDTPRVDECTFIERESSKKFIYHVKELNTSPIVRPDKYILRMAGLPTRLMRFRAEQGNNFRYPNTIQELPTKRDALIVVNHNPLFRMRMYGRLPYYRTVTQILASVLNTCMSLKHLNKHQFIMIPWTTDIFPKELFVRSRQKLSNTTVRKPNSFQYILMMHMVNYLHPDGITSMFKEVDDETLSQITFILNIDEKYLFFNMKDMKEFNVGNRYYLRFINMLNMLAVVSRADKEDVPEELKELPKVLNTVVADTSESTQSPIETKIEENNIQQTVEDDEKNETIINKVAKSVVRKLTKKSTVSLAVPSATAVVEASDKKDDKKLVSVKSAANVTKIVEISDKDNYAKDYVEDLDNETNEFIEAREELTPAAKKHFKQLATKYKQCTIDGISIEKLLLDNSDLSLTDTTLDEKITGYVPDKSCLTSSLHSFEKDYRQKTYRKHLAGVISGFQRNGLFLVKVEQVKNIDSLNNSTTYKCQYAAIDGTKTTISFTVPNLDSNDRFITDGVSQVLKKQRCPLPIIKINESEISLASNYNKTRVIRNENKAHSYVSFIDSIINDTAKSTAYIVFGSEPINLPVSYEYATLATKFRTVEFKHENEIYNLNFSYSMRETHFEGKPELFKKLEAEYGTYVGRTKHDYLFIDVDNTVYAVKKTGGEDTSFPFRSLIDIFKLSLKPDVTIKKNFTEWLTIKILDANLPVIFLLAYRYGLRNILDYMGLEYCITENRSKVIIGESATENYTDTVNLDPEEIYGFDWIESPTKEGGVITSNSRGEKDETDVDVIHSSDNHYNLLGLESLDRPVKPRLGKIAFFISQSISKDALEPYNLKIKAMLIEIKLGTKHTVVRRVVNYDGTLFKSSSNKRLPKTVLEKAADYLHCSEAKISRASITIVKEDAPLPPAVTKAKQMSSAEYSKVTSKLNNEETRVGGNESFVIGMEDISEERRYIPKPNDIHIKFADRTLHFNRYPLAKSLIVAGLDTWDLSSYELADMEDKDVYYRILVDNGKSPNLLKGIESTFDLFIDNMTYQVLKTMHEPTNMRDLLLRCGVILSTMDHKPASSAANHRLRGYEQFPAIIYNEMAREVANYKSRRGNGNKFSVNPQAIYLRIIQNQSSIPSDASNPVEDVRIYSHVTYAGIGGRTGESFVLRDRVFADDDVGIISEGVPESGKVGLNAVLSFNPTIATNNGILVSKDPKELKASNCFSMSALVMPFSSNDDPKRIDFISIQTAHSIPVAQTDICRIRTGYERILAHRVTKNFAGMAANDGTVTKIDEVAKLVEVTYKDGSKDLFPYGDRYIESESIEFTQPLKLAVKLHQKFKKGEVITYNSAFFKQDHFTKQLDYSIGVTANVAMLETDKTNEDSTEISPELAEKLAISPVHTKAVTLSAKSLIHSCVNVGDSVTPSQPLIVFEEDPVGDNPLANDAETIALLSEMNRHTPKAGAAGTVVKIDAYCGTDELSPTLAPIVRKVNAGRKAEAKMAADIGQDGEYLPVTVIKKGTKYKGVDFDEDTVLLIFHIQEKLKHAVGDKIVVCNQIKCTCCSIFPKPITTESGVHIDLLFSQKAQNGRIVLSPILTGITSRILEKVENDIVKMYFN